MDRRRIETVEDKYFDFCWKLYLEAFPEEERRPYDYHLEVMDREHFHFDVVINGEVSVGFIAWWDLDDFRYIEHFATDSELRGNGLGRMALEQFILENDKPILLEVEHPVSEIEKRRIAFYQRLGLVLNPYHYEHPSYHSGDDDNVCLLVMTYPMEISQQQLDSFMELGFPKIHFRRF